MSFRNQPSARWLELSVRVPAAAEEAVADLLRRYVPGGVSIEANESSVVVRGYLPDGGDLARRRRAIRRRLAASTLPVVLSNRWLRQDDWAHTWKQFFPILRVGSRLVICPSWRRPRPRPAEVTVRLDPGLAFGTGQHPTTLMCLRALEDLVRPGMSVLDLGTGSGILALAAAKLGATSVLALDIDPQVVAVARQNVRLNGLEDRVRVEEGSLDEGVEGSFDLAVANLNAAAIIGLAAPMAGALRPSGALIAAGFSSRSAEEVASALAATGLTVERELADDDWRAFVACKG